MIIICPKELNINNTLKDMATNINISFNKDIQIITCDDNIILFDILKANEQIKYLALENTTTPLVNKHTGKIQIKNKTFESNKDFLLICGPCSIESLKQFNDNIDKINHFPEVAGVRCGAFKPRTSPYGFQGLKKNGVAIVNTANNSHDKLLTGEITNKEQIDHCPFDILQIGTRNMQNYELLKSISKTSKPIILKRGMSASIDEWLSAAEYLLQNNHDVILCERGIKSFENSTRATLDLSSIPVIKSRTNLPVIVDPSHAAGKREYIEQLSYAAIAAGADGLLIECSINPKEALSDGRQTIDYETLTKIINTSKKLLPIFNRRFYES